MASMNVGVELDRVDEVELHKRYNDFDRIPKNATLKAKSFEARASEQSIVEFKQLLLLSKLGPATYENTTGGQLGITRDWLKNTKEHWLTRYNWRNAETRLNSFPNFKVPIEYKGDIFDTHFVALFSQSTTAIPVILMHGWPGSVFEFVGTLELLRKKYTAATLPYHIIVPSLPGYGYSSGPPLTKDFDLQDMSAIMDKLMLGLGFANGYIAQGGDLGSFMARIMGVTSKSCKAVHLNLSVAAPPDDVPIEALTDLEREGLARGARFSELEGSYARQQGNKPATIGHVLSASPLALLSWIGEKLLTWVDKPLPLDSILDSVTLYWLTETYPRCIYPYREFFSARPQRFYHPDPEWYLKVPTGYSWFPKELNPAPRLWVAKTCDMVWYKIHSEGGHFAALENPQVFLDDVEEFVETVRGRF